MQDGYMPGARRQAPCDEYDYVVCGAGSSGCVVASRLSEDPSARVLLLEAGDTDDIASVRDPGLWYTNIDGPLDWRYRAEPAGAVNGRSLALPMGKALGGGSSINAMVWARGHKNDFDYWAAQAGDPAWSYEQVLSIYRRIENWQGVPDPRRRGNNGLLWIEPARDPNPIAPAMLEAARSVGIPSFPDQNGAMMEGAGGCAIANLRIKDGLRRNIPADYLYPAMDRPNLTVLTGATIHRLLLDGKHVTGVEYEHHGQARTVRAARETILSAGALNTPKILMLSGIGERQSLSNAGIETRHHLPGVGRNFQDHVLLAGCVWEYEEPLEPRNNAAECTFFWKSRPDLDTPDLQPFQMEIPFVSEVTGKQYSVPEAGWTLGTGLVRPQSRGRVQLRSANPADPLRVEANFLSHPDDMRALVRGVELSREIGSASALRAFSRREVMPGPLKGKELENFIRNAATTYFHATCTCKMGRDDMSVVDARLKVHGLEGVRIADGSIMPRITTGNTMAPCVIIGERLAQILKQA